MIGQDDTQPIHSGKSQMVLQALKSILLLLTKTIYRQHIKEDMAVFQMFHVDTKMLSHTFLHVLEYCSSFFSHLTKQNHLEMWKQSQPYKT